MAFNNGRLIGGNDMSLSVVNPISTQVVQLTLNYFLNFEKLGYSRTPIPETVPSTSYSWSGEAITPGNPDYQFRRKHRHSFDTRMDEDQLALLWALIEVNKQYQGSVPTDHRILVRDTRQLFLELGNTNSRGLAEGPVDTTNIPGTAQYFAEFYADFEQYPSVFNLNDSFAGRSGPVWDGTSVVAGVAPQYRVAWTMIETDPTPA